MIDSLNEIATKLHWDHFKFGVLLATVEKVTETSMYDNSKAFFLLRAKLACRSYTQFPRVLGNPWHQDTVERLW